MGQKSSLLHINTVMISNCKRYRRNRPQWPVSSVIIKAHSKSQSPLLSELLAFKEKVGAVFSCGSRMID